jgi:hypothetical protein
VIWAETWEEDRESEGVAEEVGTADTNVVEIDRKPRKWAGIIVHIKGWMNRLKR